MHGTIIIGGGQAGTQVAITLRAEGYQAPIRIFAQEALLPYQRPPLSKAYLIGTMSAQHLQLRPAAFYEAQNIDVRLGVEVTSIDRAARHAATSSGEMLSYDHLVLATGSRNRALALPGAAARNVFALRTLNDAATLKAAFAAAHHIIVIGGGFIGLEFAAVASKLHKSVHIIEIADRLMARAVGEQISQWYMALHQNSGTQVLLKTQVRELILSGDLVTGVRLDDDRILPCDLLVYGVGAIANAEIAAEAGLTTGAGISVDAHMQTSDPRILAIGDCAEHPNRYFHAGASIRLESVQNAVDQGKTAAETILGRQMPYHVVPWFWSDQFDAKLQIAGLNAGADASIVRGDPAQGRFSVFYFRQNALIAVDSINMASDHIISRRLLARDMPITFAHIKNAGPDLRVLL